MQAHQDHLQRIKNQRQGIELSRDNPVTHQDNSKKLGTLSHHRRRCDDIETNPGSFDEPRTPQRQRSQSPHGHNSGNFIDTDSAARTSSFDARSMGGSIQKMDWSPTPNHETAGLDDSSPTVNSWVNPPGGAQPRYRDQPRDRLNNLYGRQSQPRIIIKPAPVVAVGPGSQSVKYPHDPYRRQQPRLGVGRIP